MDLQPTRFLMLRTHKKQLWSGSILLCYPICTPWSVMECKEVCILAHGQTAIEAASTFISSTSGFLTLSVFIWQDTSFSLADLFYLFVWFFLSFWTYLLQKSLFRSHFCSLIFFHQVSKKSVCVLLKVKTSLSCFKSCFIKVFQMQYLCLKRINFGRTCLTFHLS